MNTIFESFTEADGGCFGCKSNAEKPSTTDFQIDKAYINSQIHKFIKPTIIRKDKSESGSNEVKGKKLDFDQIVFNFFKILEFY